MDAWKNIGISLFALLGMLALVVGLMLMPTRNPVILRAQGQLVQILESRTLWMAVVMLFLVYTVPGLGTALTYRQADVLKFQKEFIGRMGSLEGIFGVIAALAYGVFCRRLNLRALLVGAIAMNAAATLLYLVYTRGTAPLIHSLGGFVGVLSELALMDLAVRSTPVGCEALGFSLMMSVRNFGIALSDVLGSKLMDQYHMEFSTLVWVNAGTTFVILLFVPFLPRLIMLRREGEPAPEDSGQEAEGSRQ
jgi:predicted MFS family arabinose efflux permease